MIEVITVVNMLVEVKNTKDYEKKVEKILQSKTRSIQHIETINMSEPNEKLIVSALVKYRVLIEERMENKFLDDYVGLVLPMFYNRFKAMPEPPFIAPPSSPARTPAPGSFHPRTKALPSSPDSPAPPACRERESRSSRSSSIACAAPPSSPCRFP